MKFLNILKPAFLVTAIFSFGLVTATLVTTTTPTSGQVKVQAYDYDGSIFSGQIYVRLFQKIGVKSTLINMLPSCTRFKILHMLRLLL